MIRGEKEIPVVMDAGGNICSVELNPACFSIGALKEIIQYQIVKASSSNPIDIYMYKDNERVGRCSNVTLLQFKDESGTEKEIGVFNLAQKSHAADRIKINSCPETM